MQLINSDSQIQDTIFRNHEAEYKYSTGSIGLLLKDSTVNFKNATFNNNYHGIHVESGDCPDLSKVDFGTGDDANYLDVYPVSCNP